MRRFNITGTCRPAEHYMVDITQRLETITEMVARGDYMCINRGRQYGKTTTLNALKTYLGNRGYSVFMLSFEGLGDDVLHSLDRLCAAFISILCDAIDFNEVTGISEAAKDLLAKTNTQYAQTGMPELEFCRFVSRLCQANPLPVVIIIDEVDQASNSEPFVRFLGLLRRLFLTRDTRPTFQSVILASVYDVRNLKLKMRPTAEHDSNSPWNIAVPFEVDMSLPQSGIQQMLDEYANDHQSDFDTTQVASWIYEYTSGYPFLVSRLCMLMDASYDWSHEGFLAAVKQMLTESNTLFDDLNKKITDFPNVRKLLEDILFRGMTISFVNDNPAVELAAKFGYVVDVAGKVSIANRIFETRLYQKFASEREGDAVYASALRSKPEFVRDGQLDMALILDRFVQTFHDIYGDCDEKFVEAEGRRFFMLYTKPIINGVGHFYVEAQTRDFTRTDLIIDYLGHQYVIEMKIWHGNAYNERGEKQLAEYLDHYHLQTGYMLSFCFNKNKKMGLMPPKQIGGRTLIEAIV